MLSNYQLQAIAAKKASALENKQKGRNGTKQMLHGMVEGLQELMDLNNSDADDSFATAFIYDSAETEPSSEEDVKGDGHDLADLHVDSSDSDFLIGILQAEISRLYGLQTILCPPEYD